MAAGGGHENKRERSKVDKNPGGEERSAGGEISYHHHGFNDSQKCLVVSVQAWGSWQERSEEPCAALL